MTPEDHGTQERFWVENRPEGACVISDQDEPGTVMALCGRQQDAEEIAAALTLLGRASHDR